MEALINMSNNFEKNSIENLENMEPQAAAKIVSEKDNIDAVEIVNEAQDIIRAENADIKQVQEAQQSENGGSN